MHEISIICTVGGRDFDLDVVGVDLSPHLSASRSQGQKKPNGQFYETNSVSLKATSILDGTQLIDKILQSQNSDAVEFVELHLIYAYAGQCNLEFSDQELRELIRVGASFSVSCYDTLSS